MTIPRAATRVYYKDGRLIIVVGNSSFHPRDHLARESPTRGIHHDDFSISTKLFGSSSLHIYIAILVQPALVTRGSFRTGRQRVSKQDYAGCTLPNTKAPHKASNESCSLTHTARAAGHVAEEEKAVAGRVVSASINRRTTKLSYVPPAESGERETRKMLVSRLN